MILNGFYAAAVACSLVQRNSVPSTQMRCMITASRRASATIAAILQKSTAPLANGVFMDTEFDSHRLAWQAISTSQDRAASLR